MSVSASVPISFAVRRRLSWWSPRSGGVRGDMPVGQNITRAASMMTPDPVAWVSRSWSCWFCGMLKSAEERVLQ
jgi:hypothetical protein